MYEDDTTRCFAHCFEATWDGPITHTDTEVAWGRWMTLPDLDALLEQPQWPFVPDTRRLLARLVFEGLHDYTALESLLPPGRSESG